MKTLTRNLIAAIAAALTVGGVVHATGCGYGSCNTASYVAPVIAVPVVAQVVTPYAPVVAVQPQPVVAAPQVQAQAVQPIATVAVQAYAAPVVAVQNYHRAAFVAPVIVQKQFVQRQAVVAVKAPAVRVAVQAPVVRQKVVVRRGLFVH